MALKIKDDRSLGQKLGALGIKGDTVNRMVEMLMLREIKPQNAEKVEEVNAEDNFRKVVEVEYERDENNKDSLLEEVDPISAKEYTGTQEYIELNNQVNKRDKAGNVDLSQLAKDKASLKVFFRENVTKRLVDFKNFPEKINFLVDNGYYDEQLLEKYTMDEIRTVYKIAYRKNFRFQSYMSASKFYQDYAMLSNDGSRILERYEDRVSIVALTLGGGNIEIAKTLCTHLINQEYQPATPTFLNAGRKRGGEMVSCFLMECGDSLNNINMAESMSKQVSKIGGGGSTNLSKVRAKGEDIRNIENVTKGVVGVMKMLDHAYRYADQMGQRPGSGAVYLHGFHADVLDFLGTKKITADEDVRVKTLSIGLVLHDKFYELCNADADMHLFYPHSVFKETGEYLDEIDINKRYDELVANPRIRKKKIKARYLLEEIAILRFESGYPYLMFADNVNRIHANNHISRVKFSNLCSEILQASIVSEFTDYGEPDTLGLDISCNLGSLNIMNVMANKSLGPATLVGMKALTYVARITRIKNAPAIARGNELMQSVALGAMNLHGYLANVGIAYESEEAKEFADIFFSTMNYWTLVASMNEAKETGQTYYGYEGSTYADGTYFRYYLKNPTNEQFKTDTVRALFSGMFVPSVKDWAKLMVDVKTYGLYHSYRMAIAPTGSISYIQNSTASIMPVSQKIENRTEGNKTTFYPMPGLSMATWFLYKEAYHMDMYKVIDLIAVIQRHVDQGISTTVYLNSEMTTRDVSNVEMYAWRRGLKTLYYARTNKNNKVLGCVACAM